MADGLDDALIKQIGAVVSQQIETQMQTRDKMLVEMQKSMQAMMKEMQKVTSVGSARHPQQNRQPRRVRVAPAKVNSPRAPKKATVKPKLKSPRRGKTLMKARGPKPKGKHRLIRPDDISTLPRVAQLGDRKLYTKEACKARADDYRNEEAEWQRCTIQYKAGKRLMTVFAPEKYSTKDYKEPVGFRDEPDTELVLDFIHGYHCTGTYTNFEGSSNIFYLKNPDDPDAPGAMIWYTSAVVIIYDPKTHLQRFYSEHDDDVTALAVHPNGVVIATGQVAKDPRINVWDSGAAAHAGTLPPEDGAELPTYPLPPETMCQLFQHKVHIRGIKSLEFSPDGKLLCSVGEGDSHNVAIWDWDDGVLLTSARGHNAPVYTCRFNPYQYVGIPDDDDPKAGEAFGIDDTCYTLVSCGDRHIKFWVFHRIRDPELGADNDDSPKKKKGKDPMDMLKNDGKKRSMSACGDPTKIWRLECNQGDLGKGGDPPSGNLQNFNCLTFVDDSPPMRERDDAGDIVEVGVADDGRKIGDHTKGRIVAGTENGDIYIFVQSRRSPAEEQERMSKDDFAHYLSAIYGDDEEYRDPEILEKWWECADPEDTEIVTERISWLPEARIVYNIPHDVQTGNMQCLGRPQQEALAEVLRRLKARPKDEELLADKKAMQYSGDTGHANGVHALAYHRAANQIMSAGGDGLLTVWEVGMSKAYTFEGIDGAEREDVGKHSLTRVPGAGKLKGRALVNGTAVDFGSSDKNRPKQICLRTNFPLKNLEKPGEGYEVETLGAAFPKTEAHSLLWDTSDPDCLRVAIGTNTNSIVQLNSETMQFDLLVTAHTGCVEGLGFNILDANLFCTTSRDKTLRIWSVDRPGDKDAPAQSYLSRVWAKNYPKDWCLNLTKIHAPGICCAWHPDGSMIAVGCETGEFCVYRIEDGGADLHSPLKVLVEPRQTGKVKKASNRKMTAAMKKFADDQEAKRTGKQKLFKEFEEIADIKFSQDGRFLACGSRDNFIHVYHCENKFRRIGICRGHSSFITHLDFSANGEMIQSNDGAYELLFWQIEPIERNGKSTYKVQQYTSSFAARDVTWDDWTCVLGWPVQGIWPKFSDGTDVNSAHCCNQKKYLVTGDDYFKVTLFKYPCMPGAKRKEYSGHCSHVMNVRFMRDDSRVVSAGGNDCSVFVWKHRYCVGAIVNGVEIEEEDLEGGKEFLVKTTKADIEALENAEIEDCFVGKEAEEAEDAMHREGLDADFDLDALKRKGRLAHGFDAGDGVNQELGRAAHAGDPTAKAYAKKEEQNKKALADATMAGIKAGGHQMAKALFDNEPDEEDELKFSAGDMIKVTSKDDEWWTGEFDGKSGMFPASYVEVVLS